jgi:diguanylate cyclase (GGDEF)-like protein
MLSFRIVVWEVLMDEAAAQPMRLSDEDVLRDRVAELAGELRAAAMKGDTTRMTRLLSDLLQFKRLTPERRLALEGLTHLIDSMRSLALTDELTGIYNRRGFLQTGKRFLDVARRDLRSAYFVYIDLNNLKEVNDSAGHAAGDELIRQTGNFLRELFPSYGVREVLGRLGGDEFAALTTERECPSRSEILLRARMRQALVSDRYPLSLSVGLAYFNPLLPTGINELLEEAERAMYEHKRTIRLAAATRSAIPLEPARLATRHNSAPFSGVPGTPA